jgi:hypothetical protein
MPFSISTNNTGEFQLFYLLVNILHCPSFLALVIMVGAKCCIFCSFLYLLVTNSGGLGVWLSWYSTCLKTNDGEHSSMYYWSVTSVILLLMYSHFPICIVSIYYYIIIFYILDRSLLSYICIVSIFSQILLKSMFYLFWRQIHLRFFHGNFFVLPK